MTATSKPNDQSTNSEDINRPASLRLGIVLIGRNEGERLAASLASIPKHYPCVYVDSGSTDGSVELAKENGAMVHELDPALPFTASRARAEGADQILAAHSNLDAIQFVDGDCMVEEGWFQEANAALLTNSNTAAVCGRRRERFPERSHYNAMFDAEWDTPIGEADSTGGDALFRVDAYRSVGGFNPAITAGEEPELNYRLRQAGWRILRIDAPMTIHDADMHHFSQWWKRTERSGFGYFQAFVATRGRSHPALYGKELARAFGWTAIVPLFALALSLAAGPAWLLIAPAIWLTQFTRLAIKQGPQMAFYLMVGKAGEAIGATKAIWSVFRRSSKSAITYK